MNNEVIDKTKVEEQIDYEIDDDTTNILNNSIVSAIIDLLYKREIINKKEHTTLLSCN